MQRSLVGWLLALTPGVMFAVLLWRPVWDVDVFWQLRLGELILAHGGPLGREPFSASHLGEPLPAVAWLGQVVMAGARQMAGWTGLRVLDALCWLGGFLVVGWACRHRGDAAAGVAMGLAVAFLAALPMASLRPQSFAALGFGLLIALLRLRLPAGRTALIAVPLLVLWQNLHPSVSVAALPLGVHAAIGWWRWLRGKGGTPWETSGLTVAALAAMVVTPDGFGILAMSARNAATSAAMGVSEWLPLWDPVNRTVAVPVLVAAVIAAWSVWRQRSRIEPTDLAVAIALLVLTLAAYRFVLFWAIALIPLFARAAPPGESRAPPFVAALGLAIAAVAIPVLRPTHFAQTIPLEAIARLPRAEKDATIFVHFPWGGPAIDAGWRVAYDGRFYRYDSAEWQRYRATRTDPASLAEIESRFRPAGFVLDPDWNAALIAALRADPAHWREVSARSAVVFVPAGR